MSKILVPELQYYFYNFVVNSKLNKNQTLFPSKINDKYFNSGSFIQLLFDDNWPKKLSQYNYFFKKISRSSYPQIILDKLSLYSQKSKYYICDSSSNADMDLFNLKNDDHKLLKLLLKYRCDSTCDISVISFSSLSTNLSKLIYLFLDLNLNDNFSYYDNENIFSVTILEMMYESYIQEKIFKFIYDRGT